MECESSREKIFNSFQGQVHYQLWIRELIHCMLAPFTHFFVLFLSRLKLCSAFQMSLAWWWECIGFVWEKDQPTAATFFVVDVVFSLCYVRKGVAVYEARFQEETARGIGVIRSSLRGKRINRNGLLTEVTAKRRAREWVKEVKRWEAETDQGELWLCTSQPTGISDHALPSPPHHPSNLLPPPPPPALLFSFFNCLNQRSIFLFSWHLMTFI